MDLIQGLIGLGAMGIWAYVFVTIVDKVIMGENVMAEIRKNKNN